MKVEYQFRQVTRQLLRQSGFCLDLFSRAVEPQLNDNAQVAQPFAIGAHM